MKDQVAFDDFAKIDLRVGEILEAKEVEGSEKLLELTVDFGPAFAESSGGQRRTIFAGIKKSYSPDSLVGRKLIFVANLGPKKFSINGKECVSEGMLLATGDGEAVLYAFDKDVPAGTSAH